MADFLPDLSRRSWIMPGHKNGLWICCSNGRKEEDQKRQQLSAQENLSFGRKLLPLVVIIISLCHSNRQCSRIVADIQSPGSLEEPEHRIGVGVESEKILLSGLA